MRYPRIAALLYSTPLAILPAKLAEIKAFLGLKFAGGDVKPEEVRRIVAGRRTLVLPPGSPAFQARVSGRTAPPRWEIVAGRGDASNGVQRAGRVAVVPVLGTISQRGGNMEDVSTQMVSCEEVGRQLDTLAADKSCKAICMLFDSPGGSVYGVGELANKINSLKSEKKIVAMVDSVCASAAYWLASACSEVCICPGGMAGSIGVLCAHEDHGGEAEQAGVKTTLVTSSKYKAEGNPFGPMDDEARADMQAKCDAYHAMFVSAVARGRGVSEGVVNRNFGQGRMLMAKDARAAGMVDTVTTFAAVLNRLGAEGSPGAKASAPGAGLSPMALAARERAAACFAEASAAVGRPSPASAPSRLHGGNGGRITAAEARRRVREITRECGGL